MNCTDYCWLYWDIQQNHHPPLSTFCVSSETINKISACDAAGIRWALGKLAADYTTHHRRNALGNLQTKLQQTNSQGKTRSSEKLHFTAARWGRFYVERRWVFNHMLFSKRYFLFARTLSLAFIRFYLLWYRITRKRSTSHILLIPMKSTLKQVVFCLVIFVRNSSCTSKMRVSYAGCQ